MTFTFRPVNLKNGLRLDPVAFLRRKSLATHNAAICAKFMMEALLFPTASQSAERKLKAFYSIEMKIPINARQFD